MIVTQCAVAPVEIALTKFSAPFEFSLDAATFSSATLVAARSLTPLERMRLRILFDCAFPVEGFSVNDRLKEIPGYKYDAYSTLCRLADVALVMRNRWHMPGLASRANADTFRISKAAMTFFHHRIIPDGAQIPIAVRLPRGTQVPFETFVGKPDLTSSQQTALLFLDRQGASGCSSFGLNRHFWNSGLKYHNATEHLQALVELGLARKAEQQYYLTDAGRDFAIVLRAAAP